VTLRRLDRLNLKLSTELPVSAVAGEPAGVKSLVMALLSFVESAPRASRLKVGTPTFSEIQQNPGTSPRRTFARVRLFLPRAGAWSFGCQRNIEPVWLTGRRMPPIAFPPPPVAWFRAG
jgi:hypothetical protein